MKILKKAGWFIVSMLPAVLSMLLQFGCGFVMLFVYVFLEMLQAQGPGNSFDDAMVNASDLYLENAIYAVILYQVVALLVFGLWYYLAYGSKKRPEHIEKPDALRLTAVVFLGVFGQILITGVLNLIYIIRPELLQSYLEMMKISGITELTAAAFIATVILAPIGEELLCRGIIFRLAGKVSENFWIANCIQALAFALIHGNLVQGTYAFFVGLTLGYIYGKYRNIWVCMLLHGACNLTSGFIDQYYLLFPSEYAGLVLIFNMTISVLLIVVCFKILGKPGKSHSRML